jgi:hypothetical protein
MNAAKTIIKVLKKEAGRSPVSARGSGAGYSPPAARNGAAEPAAETVGTG